MRISLKKLGSENGSVLVETAVSMIVFLCVLLGIFETFMAVYTYHYVSYAAREGARYAMVRGDECYIDSTTMPGCASTGASQADVQNYIYDLNFPGINPSAITVTVGWYAANTGGSTQTWSTTACDTTVTNNTCKDPGNLVKVTVSYSNPLNLPFIPSGAIPLSFASSSSVVISQ